MAIERFPAFTPPINQLFGLANRSFEPHTFRCACDQFATFEPGSSSGELWRFSLGGGPTLMVALKAEQTETTAANGWPEYQPVAVSRVILSICWWETFMQSQHVDHQSWQREREEFDQCYSDSLASAITVLGPPRIEGSEADEYRLRYAIWRGATGLLILQQSAYDPQFGLDVNYWIQPWSGSDPRPESPFIDWLCRMRS